jgi:hypothetical protein
MKHAAGRVPPENIISPGKPELKRREYQEPAIFLSSARLGVFHTAAPESFFLN